MLGDLAAKDHRDLLRLSDGSIGVKQTLADLVQRRTTAEYEVVAEFDLREEQSVSATGLVSLSCSEKGCEVRKPLSTARGNVGYARRPCQPSRRAPAFTMTATARPLSRSALTRWLQRRKAAIRPNAASARFDGSGFRRTGGHAGLSTKARDASRSSRVRGGRVRSGRVSSGRSRCLLWHSTSVRNNTSHRQAVVPPQRMRHSIDLASRTESEILAQKSDVY